MGLKCRLLGHTYGDTEVQRTREEQGDEVVVTIREVQVCERCGAEQTVSQNKEVTAIRTPAEVGLGGDAETGGSGPGADPAAQSASAPASSAEVDQSASGDAQSSDAEGADAEASVESATNADAAGGVDDEGHEAGEPPAEASAESPAAAEGDAVEADSPIDEAEAASEETKEASDRWETGSDDWEDVDADPDADDGVILDETERERDEAQWPEEAETDPASAAQQSQAAENGEAAPDDGDEQVTNDAEIIDGTDEEEQKERGHGEWPEREDGPEPGGWPEHQSDDEGFDATTNVDEDVELGGSGLTPDVNGRADLDDADSVEGVAVEGEREPSRERARGQSRADEGFARAGSSTSLESDVPDDRVEFYCPNCGHARGAGASSMRAGDICPECKQGYIAERER
ncbi:DUF7093 family protein [Halobellus salinisoli]|uniref:DUF7093 family protein n=1 Tax=Halobellus salinisoli TaxID=3108500 RepID=UPI00300B4C18